MIAFVNEDAVSMVAQFFPVFPVGRINRSVILPNIIERSLVNNKS